MRAALLRALLLSNIATAQSGPRARLVVGQGLNEPFAVDFDATGRMFIAEMGGNRVSVWDRRALTPLATPFNGPHHLITGPDAKIYVADLVGLSVTRELGPLMTAIIVCGRTGAAFTAELGTMKVSEEVDALRTLGVMPLRYLVMPRVLGLLLVVPLLT